MLHKIFSFSLFLVITSRCFGQEVVAGEGGFYENSQGSFAYTVGEIVTETVENSSAIFTQGFQQNFENFIGIDHLYNEFQIALFPNPFQEQITINWSDQDMEVTSIQLNDNFGRLLFQCDYSNQLSGSIVLDDLGDLAQGVYFLELTIGNTNQPLLFKLIKK